MAVPTAVYQCTISATLGGQFVQTVVHFGLDSAMSGSPYAMALDIASKLESEGWMASFLACLPADYILTSVRCKQISGTGGPTAVKLANYYSVNEGQRVGHISSAQVSPLIIWITETSPDKVGKTFLPGVSEDDIIEMRLIDDLVDAIDLFILQHIAPMTLTANTCHGAIWRRAQVGPPPVAASADWILYGRISPLIGTIRKRLRPV